MIDEIYLVTNQTSLLESNNFGSASIQDVYDYFSRKEQIEVDTETQGFDPYHHDILTLQLGDYDRQFVIDIETVDILKFKEILESDRLFLLQNAKFDLRFFLHNNIDIKNIYDTFLAECILTTGYNNRELALDQLADKYADAKLDKSVRGQINYKGLSEKVIKYAAHDVKYLSKIKEKQYERLVEEDLANPDDPLDKHTVLGLENRVVRVFAHMEYKGVRVNQKKWEKNSKEISEELEQKKEELDSIVKEEPKLDSFVPDYVQGNLFGDVDRVLNINYGSYKQKVEILNALGFDVDSSADKVLQKYQYEHDFVKELREYNGLNKLESSFGMNLLNEQINSKTGRFHPEYWQILKTGRISVKNPNTNQIPSKGKFGPMIRSAFIPKDGYKIVGGDYSQMELRELAHFSQDPKWLEIFRDPDKDMHSILAAETFNIPIDKVNEPYPENPDITYRYIQKTINYGLAYGMSAYKLSDTMGCSVNMAESIIRAFFRKVPKVSKKLEQFASFAVNNGYIVTSPPYKRKRWFPKYHLLKDMMDKRKNRRNISEIRSLKGSIERAGKNTPIQGTNADIVKLAMVNIYDRIQRENLEVNILLSVYDELQTEVVEEGAEEWRDILQEEMEKAGELIIDSVPIEAECVISNYWNK